MTPPANHAWPGAPYPLGATWDGQGVNFALWSERASAVELCLFVTCHDGFTLADLVSHGTRHNEANGEGNRDGNAENFSRNCGGEGRPDDPVILALRAQQMRNFLATS